LHTLAILGIIATLIVLGLILRRNTCPLKHVLNPTHRAGGYATPHALVLAIAFLAVFALGAFAGKTGAEYYASHFQANIVVPTTVRVIPDHRVTAPLANSINLARYPGVTTQDGLGACAAFATAWDLTYEYRMQHPTSWLRFSPRFMYDYYGATYSHGDFGSWPDQDAEVVNTLGIPKLKQYAYPPFVVASTFPTDPTLRAEAAVYRMHVGFTNISGFAQGAGQGAVDGIKAAITVNHPVLIGLPVYPEYDNASATSGLIDIPQPGEQSRGGHENVVIAYDDTKRFPGGAVGGVEVQNQWTTGWGLAGRGWLSYDFVRQYSFGLEYMRIAPLAPRAGPKPPTFVPNHGPKYLPPILNIPPGALEGVGNTVHGVILHDTHYDISSLINYWGKRYGVSPLGIAATAGTESGMNQYADRCCIPGDTSWGTFQFTNGTACGYGICSGIRDALDNPTISVELAARYYRDAIAYHGGRVQFPFAYSLYNAGYAYSDSFYVNLPYGSVAYTNFYGNFLPWWRYTQAYYAGTPGPTPKPAPKPFPVKAWGSLPYRYHGGLSWAASEWLNHYRWLGRDLNRGHFYGRSHGYMQTRFGRGVLRCWPASHRCKASRR